MRICKIASSKIANLSFPNRKNLETHLKNFTIWKTQNSNFINYYIFGI